MGGQDGSRGYLYQSIISVLSACTTNGWSHISVEPKTENDKVDISFFEEERIIKVIQVKSSINSFSKAMIKGWMKDIMEDTESEEYEIVLIGNCSASVNTFIKDVNNFIEHGVISNAQKEIMTITNGKKFKIDMIHFNQEYLMSIIRDNMSNWIYKKGYILDPDLIDQLSHASVTLHTLWGTEGNKISKDIYEKKILDWVISSIGIKMKSCTAKADIEICSYDENTEEFIEPTIVKIKSLKSYQQLRDNLLDEGKVLIEKICKITLEPCEKIIFKTNSIANKIEDDTSGKELKIGDKLNGKFTNLSKEEFKPCYKSAEIPDKEKEEVIFEAKNYWDSNISKEFFFVGNLKESAWHRGITGNMSYDGNRIEIEKHRLLRQFIHLLYKLKCIDKTFAFLEDVYVLQLCIRNIGTLTVNNLSVSLSLRGNTFHQFSLKKDLRECELKLLNQASSYIVSEEVISEIFSAKENSNVSVEESKKYYDPLKELQFHLLKKSKPDIESLISDMEEFRLEENNSGYTTYNKVSLRPGEASWLEPFPLLMCDAEEINLNYMILSDENESKTAKNIVISLNEKESVEEL